MIDSAPKISRQRRWQIRQAAAGRCRNCGRPTTLHKGYCESHAEKLRLRHRECQGSKPWTPGLPGRPPLGRAA